MNIYQHLFILIPMFCVLLYSLWGYGTTFKLYCFVFGAFVTLCYIGYLAFSVLAVVFRYIGTL